ncbi:MAG: VWA domain-containing protein, partial [Armatimonadetes bacterium]|nr:VWA domain-containing protein [Armatimonadota bacterium]
MVSLLHAGLLPWIAAVLIPVAIHLLTRRSRQRTELPTTRFVRQTLAHQSRLFRWRHLLLLLLRVLAVLALSLAFTRPHLNSRLTHPTQDRVGLVLLLDVSESMAFTSGGLSTLARAKTSALQAIAGLRSGDRANLVLCAAQPQPVFTEPIPDLAAVQNAVRQARPTVERADPAAALSMALDQLEKSNAQVRRLYLLSDFQRTNWAEVRLEGIPPAVQVVYINADSGVRENTGLTALRIRPPLPRAGEPVQVECEVFHSGPGARELPVTLSLSNGAQFTERVRLAPYSSAAARFRLRFDTPQRLECTAAVPSDALPADNVRHAVLDLRRLPVVTLVTDEDVDRPPSAAFFLGHALRPNPRTTNGFEVRAVASHQLGNPQLQVADAALVCGAPGLTPVQIEGLSRYVQDGGTLVWLLYGEEIAGQLAALGRALPAAEPLPFQVEEVTDLAGNGKGFVSLTEARYESPLLRAFKDPAAADLSRARVRRLCLTTEVDPRAELLLQYEDGTAAAVRAAEGRGNLLLLNLVPAP